MELIKDLKEFKLCAMWKLNKYHATSVALAPHMLYY